MSLENGEVDDLLLISWKKAPVSGSGGSNTMRKSAIYGCCFCILAPLQVPCEVLDSH